LGEEEPRFRSGCNNTCSFELGAIGGEMLRSVVMENMAEIAGAMDLVMAISSAIATSHSGVVNSIAVIKGFFGRSMRVRGRCNGGFRFFFFNGGSRRRYVRLR
jgi:hypothetical protein